MFWKRYQELCLKNNMKPNPVAAEIGISSGSVSQWKSGKIPKGENLLKIADYFNCSVDYLLGRTNCLNVSYTCEPISTDSQETYKICENTDEINLIQLYRLLPFSAKNEIKDFIEYKLQKLEKDETNNNEKKAVGK